MATYDGEKIIYIYELFVDFEIDKIPEANKKF